MKLNLFGWWKSKIFKIAGIVVILVLFFFVLGLNFLPAENYTLDKKTSAVIQPVVQNQQKIEKEIEAFYKSGAYSLTNPLVIQNPYGTAPLTALLIFETQEPLQISIHVPGKTPQASVDFIFAGFNKHHEIPVYGLYADYLNQVTLKGKNQAGETSETVVGMKTEPLPVYLKSVNIIKADPNAYSPGMNFTCLINKPVFDINGDIRWYSTSNSSQTFTRLENGHYLFTYWVTGKSNNLLMEQDLLGKIYAIYNIPYGVKHDFTELPNGNLLVDTPSPSSKTWDDSIIEIDRQSGHIIRNFDLKNYLDDSRPNEIGLAPEDWLHMNSIVYDSNDRSIIISGRAQSAVIKLSYPGLKIQWILGPHDNWTDMYQPYLLTPEGNNFEWQWSQHNASFLSEKSINGSEIIDILLFDNGLYHSFDSKTALSAKDSYSRIVRYEVNETDRTVEQVWEYGKERGSELFSGSQGSANLLGNGDYLGDWADITTKPGTPVASLGHSSSAHAEIIEVNPNNNQVVFEAKINEINYRIFRASLYDGYSESNSNLSVKLNNSTAMNLSERIITELQPVKKSLLSIESGLKSLAKAVLKRIGIKK